MSSIFRCFVFFLTFAASASALAYEVELELRPGDPPTPIVLPLGSHADDVRLTLEQFELASADPTPQPASRTFYVGGMPVSVSNQVAESPLRIESAKVGSREIVLLSAREWSGVGHLSSMTARIAIADSGAPGLQRPVPVGWRASIPEPEKTLAIVTTSRILERSSSLSRYIRWREAGGFRVIVGTEEDWNNPVEEGSDHRAERIRAWLRQIRETNGLGYVLLIGSPQPHGGSVPMVDTHPLLMLMPYMPPDLVEALEPVPTDHFFADLEGDWDLDGDGRYGEFPDDDGPGGVRWDVDAMVGRIPVYGDDTESLDSILDATIFYETEPNPGYRHRVLLPAAYIGFEGSPAPGGGEYEETNDGAVAAMAAYHAAVELDARAEVVRFFEEAGLIPSEYEHERPLTTADLIDEWSSGAGIVLVYAHGSTQGDYRTAWLDDLNDDGIPDYWELLGDSFLHSSDTTALHGAGRAFTFHASCENGWPEDPNNLGYSLLRNGAIGTITASRAAIGGEATFQPEPEFGDADTMAYIFAHLLLEGLRIGEVASYLKYGLPADGWGEEEGIPLNGYGWIGKFEFNLYGDPTVSLGRCSNDSECNDSTLCNGEGQCVDGYCVQGELVDCTHLDDLCNVGRCDPSSGTCSSEVRGNGTACDDGLFCTEEDVCTDGSCQGGERQCGEAPDGFVSVCIEEERRCELETAPVEPPDSGPEGDTGPVVDSGPESDAGPDGDSSEAPPQFSSRGGGCSAVAAPSSRLTAFFFSF